MNVDLCRIIINYLTPLPKRLFEIELVEKTKWITFDDRYYFYSNHFSNHLYSPMTKYPGSYKIVKGVFEKWYILSS